MILLQNYLKKYTTINSQFIDDFFGLYGTNTTGTDYVIDLDNVAKWLKTTKAHLKETLSKTYTKNFDYKITKQKIERGRPSESIKLTPNCFKRLCMLSRTKKAEEVRTYFIELEKHIDKYKNFIIDALNKKVGILENNQKHIPDPKSGVIYVMKTDQDIDNIYKIGKTKEFKSRLRTHNSSHVDNVDVVFIYESHDIDSVESCLKLALKTKQYRKKKEFYQVDIDLLKELLAGCESLMLKGKKNSKKFNSDSNMFIMIDRNEQQSDTKITSKKPSNKPSNKTSKKTSKKPKTSKKLSKKTSKITSKKTSKKITKK